MECQWYEVQHKVRVKARTDKIERNKLTPLPRDKDQDASSFRHCAQAHTALSVKPHHFRWNYGFTSGASYFNCAIVQFWLNLKINPQKKSPAWKINQINSGLTDSALEAGGTTAVPLPIWLGSIPAPVKDSEETNKSSGTMLTNGGPEGTQHEAGKKPWWRLRQQQQQKVSP